jgi:hypothetical protein
MVLSNVTNNVELAHKQSRLDLLDETTLTSLPLPPPLKRKNTDLDNDDVGNTTAEDPIVLIEDYLPATIKPRLNKKKSLAIFKSKFNKRLKVTASSQDLFVNAITTDCLKYCDLCEKPLYELSSFIGSENQVKTKRFHEFICGECVEMYEQFFNELQDENGEFNVSADTTISLEDGDSETPTFSPQEKIDEFARNLQYNHDVETITDGVGMSSVKYEATDKSKDVLLHIFQTVNDKYEIINEDHDPTPVTGVNVPASPLKRKFSDGLLHQLNALNQLPHALSNGGTWLGSFREKLRTWRFGKSIK